MSQFDFPRINFAGNVSVNVGTANNSPGSGVPQITNPNTVQPITNGMTDDEFKTFVMSEENNFPASWNYFGVMSVNFENVTVRAVQTDYTTLQTTAAECPIIGASVSVSPASMCDVDAFGVANSQVFCDQLTISDDNGTYVQAQPSKTFTRWINFQRNVNLRGSAGASGSFQFVIPKAAIEQSGSLLDLSIFKDVPGLEGVMVRFNMYGLDKPTSAAALAELYKNIDQKSYQEHMNPAIGPVMGTISPWYGDEMKTITLARLLNPTNPLQNPNGKLGGNGPDFPLAPVLAKLSEDYISLDVSNTFPEGYKIDKENPAGDYQKSVSNKYDFGPIDLTVTDTAGDTHTVIKNIPYADMTSYINQGGMMDLSLEGVDATVKSALATGHLGMALESGNKNLMLESDYMFATDQACIYAEQNGSTTDFRNDGPNLVPVNIRGAYRGVQIPADQPVKVKLYQFNLNQTTLPNGYTGKAQDIMAPNNPLQIGTENQVTVDTSYPGVQMYQIMSSDQPAPEPKSSLDNILTTAFYLTVRVLPYDDYSQYLNGTTPLTWDVLYNEVVRYYALIYPGMGLHMPYTEAAWQNMAARIYARVSLDNWGMVEHMPRTRDLSEPRRQLIQAWCKQYMPKP